MRSSKMIFRGFAAALLLASAPNGARAAANAGTTGASFLTLEQGGRGIGMGGAFTATTDEASALWWNPAGIARARYREVSVSHTKLIENIVSQYVGAIYPISPAAGTVGVSFTYLNIPGLDAYDANKKPAGTLTANSFAASLAYARMLAQSLSFGLNVKMIGQHFATESGTGVAGDVGLQYRQKNVGLGVSVQNLGPAISLAGNSTPLPLTVRAGVSFLPHPRILLAFDEVKPRDGDYQLHVGGEWKVSSAFTLRGGFQQMPNLGSRAGYTAGLGYMTSLGSGGGWAGDETPWWERKMEDSDKPVRPEGAYLVFFDYAFVSYGEYSDAHRFTLGLRF